MSYYTALRGILHGLRVLEKKTEVKEKVELKLSQFF
jgi:hypothetical protein